MNSGVRAWRSSPKPASTWALLRWAWASTSGRWRSFEEALVMSQEMGRKPQVIEALEGMASLAGAWGRPLGRRACGELRRRHARLPASLCHPASGRCTSPTWPRPVPGSGRQSGKKRWPRGGRCRSKRPPSTLSQRRRPIQPTTPVPREPLGRANPMAHLLQSRAGGGCSSSPGASPTARSPTELSISERTAGNHVAKILSKLGLRSRTQIASWAHRTRATRARRRNRASSLGSALPERRIEDPGSPDPRVLGPQHRVVVRAFDQYLCRGCRATRPSRRGPRRR